MTEYRRLLERQYLSLCGHQRRPSCLARVNRVDALANLLTSFSSTVTGSSERYVRVAAETNIAAPIPDRGAEDPAPSTAVLDL